MTDVARRAARLLEEAQAGRAEHVLGVAEAALRARTGDLADGPAALHFARVVALIMLGAAREGLAAVELMLRAAEREGSAGWLACALATRASERLRPGDADVAEHDADSILRDLSAAEATLATGEDDPVAAINAHVGIGVGFHTLRLYELAGPQYQAAYELCTGDPAGDGNPAMWLTNLAQLHLEWALELYQVGRVADAEKHTAEAEDYAVRAAAEASGPDADSWRTHAQLAAACARADRHDPAGAAADIARHLRAQQERGIIAREVAYCRPFQAVALNRSGRPDEALRVIADAVRDLPPDGDWPAAAATRRTHALLLAAGDPADPHAGLAYRAPRAGARWRPRRRTQQTGAGREEYESVRVQHELAARAAETDALTGLANRRGFDRVVDEEADRAADAGRRVTALIVDMDKLKLINDSRGHAAGDQAVCAVAAALRAVVRDGDTVARLGGDEFGVVLPGATPEVALAIAARMVAAVRDIPDCLARVSVGVASGPPGELRDTVCRADAAMYEAKRSGGDAVRGAPAA